MLRVQILTVLRSAPAGMIVSVLRQECGLRMRNRIGEAEWTMEVANLKDRGLIEDGERDAMTDDAILKLTAAGRKAAAKL